VEPQLGLGSLISSPLEVNGDFVQRPVKLKDARYASVTVDPGLAPLLGDLAVTLRDLRRTADAQSHRTRSGLR
jgi:hypothetical protein